MNRIFRLLNKSDETGRLINWWANLECGGDVIMWPILCQLLGLFSDVTYQAWAAEDHSEVITLE